MAQLEAVQLHVANEQLARPDHRVRRSGVDFHDAAGDGGYCGRTNGLCAVGKPRTDGACDDPHLRSLSRVRARFHESDSTDLSAFRDRGGKLVIVHGAADPVFSLADTVDWWNALNKVEGGGASNFARVYAVPGMNHCGGGPSTDQFDAFGALVEWVEKGTSPDRIIAKARAATMWPGRTRPLCPYPQRARYSASGSIEEAANFVCR